MGYLVLFAQFPRVEGVSQVLENYHFVVRHVSGQVCFSTAILRPMTHVRLENPWAHLSSAGQYRGLASARYYNFN